MTDPPPYPDTNDETGARSGHGSPSSTPLWVKIIGIVIMMLFVLFLVLQHLIGGGMSGLHQ